MDRFIDGIELTAAVFIGIVALDVFVTVMLRYVGVSIPDSYDLGQLLLGILIFWGIAATSYRGGAHHRRSGVGQRRPTLAARHRCVRDACSFVRRGGADLHAVRQGGQHLRRQRQHLRAAPAPVAVLPVAWLGDAAAVLLIAVRTYRLIFYPEAMARAAEQIKPVE